MEEKRVVVVSAANLHKIELMKLMNKYVIVEDVHAGFSPAHTIPYDMDRMQEIRDKFLQAPPPPQIDNRKSMRNFVRSHSRRGRR